MRCSGSDFELRRRDQCLSLVDVALFSPTASSCLFQCGCRFFATLPYHDYDNGENGLLVSVDDVQD